MKKAIGILLAVLLILNLSILLTACGGSGGNAEGGDTGGADAANKTMAYFNEYVSGGAYTMEMKTNYDGTETTMYAAYDNGNMYSESEMDGTKSIMIIKDEYQYILDPNTKTCMKMSVTSSEQVAEMFSEEAAQYEVTADTGTMDIDGKSYDYEAFEVEGETVKYCFDGDDLKYIVMNMEGSEYIAEIISMEKGADASLFEVPDGYTVMEL